jgi:uncharacterized protein YecE (DUF72 family)
MPALCIGTSGWVYKHWMGVFYPDKTPGEKLLPFYAERFRTVEVNFSYYRLPERSVFEAWRKQTPDDFLFAVKGSRYLTHMKKLKDPEQPLERLMQSAGGLQEKLGPILFQFPRWWSVNRERLRQFLETLGAYPGQRYAFEFRHRSWLAPEVYDLLQQHNAALCLPVGWDIPLEVRQTADWTYIRFHGAAGGAIGFSDEELTTWAGRVRSFLDQGVDVFAYFNNDPEGHAVHDAARLRDLLG